MLQYVAGLFVWITILAILVGGAFAALACFQYAAQTTNGLSPTAVQAMTAMGYVFAIATGLFFCAVLFMRDRIAIAIQVTKEASKALLDMPSLLLFPLLPLLWVICYFIWWLYTAMVLFSVNTTKSPSVPNPVWGNNALVGLVPSTEPDSWPEDKYYTFSANTDMQNVLILHFFHLLWNVQFAVFFTFLVLAGAVANWYFTPWLADGSTKERGDDEHVRCFGDPCPFVS